MSVRKILPLEVVAERLDASRARGETIVHCHGCFDLVHIGHIRHLQAARRMGDVLVVTLTADEYVAKGEGRPVFTESLRAESLAALECVDLVAVSRAPTAEKAIRLLRPHYYVKGQVCAPPARPSEKLRAEMAAVHEVAGEMRFTDEIVFSSTALFDAHFRP
jgi:rfaE bifunctional protein nucleotidyltransferase chain/domain